MWICKANQQIHQKQKRWFEAVKGGEHAICVPPSYSSQKSSISRSISSVGISVASIMVLPVFSK